jgi:hypothetical protein
MKQKTAMHFFQTLLLVSLCLVVYRVLVYCKGVGTLYYKYIIYCTRSNRQRFVLFSSSSAKSIFSVGTSAFCFCARSLTLCPLGTHTTRALQNRCARENLPMTMSHWFQHLGELVLHYGSTARRAIQKDRKGDRLFRDRIKTAQQRRHHKSSAAPIHPSTINY